MKALYHTIIKKSLFDSSPYILFKAVFDNLRLKSQSSVLVNEDNNERVNNHIGYCQCKKKKKRNVEKKDESAKQITKIREKKMSVDGLMLKIRPFRVPQAFLEQTALNDSRLISGNLLQTFNKSECAIFEPVRR